MTEDQILEKWRALNTAHPVPPHMKSTTQVRYKNSVDGTLYVASEESKVKTEHRHRNREIHRLAAEGLHKFAIARQMGLTANVVGGVLDRARARAARLKRRGVA